MTKRPYTGPTGINLAAGRLHIDGYPEAERVVKMSTKQARRLADLRLHQSALIFCTNAVQAFETWRDQYDIVTEAMLIGIITKFFSCFGNNKSSTPLNPDRVFKGMPDARRCFTYWKNLRDKHFIHNESDISFLITGLVLGPDAEVQDVLSMNFQPGITRDAAHCQLLFRLIAHTKKHVDEEIHALLPRLFEEARAMSPQARAALPDVTYTVPGSDRASITRT